MRKLYLYLYIPKQPIMALDEEWHMLATINTCYSALMADIVEQFRLSDVERNLTDKRRLILVTADSEEDALKVAKTKL